VYNEGKMKTGRVALLMGILLFMSSLCILPSAFGKEADNKKTTKIHELQERCDKNSADFSRIVYGSRYDITGINHTYEDHYNRKLDKCFIMIRTVLMDKDENGNMAVIGRMAELYEVLGKTYYGRFFESDDIVETCHIRNRNTPCNSEQGWYVLVKPYMDQ